MRIYRLPILVDLIGRNRLTWIPWLSRLYWILLNRILLNWILLLYRIYGLGRIGLSRCRGLSRIHRLLPRIQRLSRIYRLPWDQRRCRGRIGIERHLRSHGRACHR